MTNVTTFNTTHKLPNTAWRKSSRSGSGSGGGGSCVEVAAFADFVGVRDSKNIAGEILVFSFAQWKSFLHVVKNSKFDMPQ